MTKKVSRWVKRYVTKRRTQTLLYKGFVLFPILHFRILQYRFLGVLGLLYHRISRLSKQQENTLQDSSQKVDPTIDTGYDSKSLGPRKILYRPNRDSYWK